MAININVTPGNNPNINVVPQGDNSIDASTSTTNIAVSNVGIQGAAGTGSIQSSSGFAGVATINGVSGELTFAGTGNVTLIIDGQTFTFSGVESVNNSINLFGLISTGDADQRYLQSGASGYFYPISNPNQFIRSGEVDSVSVSYSILRSGDSITGLNYVNGDFTYIFYSGDLITGVFNSSNQNKKILYDNSDNITGIIYY